MVQDAPLEETDQDCTAWVVITEMDNEKWEEKVQNQVTVKL